MARQMIALCDSNSSYGARLAEYLEGQVAFPFSIMQFSDADAYMRYGKEHRIGESRMEILILSEDVLKRVKYDDGVTNVFVLTEKERVEEVEKLHFVYRYQSAAVIMHAILAAVECPKEKVTSKTKIIGAFHPFGRSLQTSFLTVLGAQMSQKQRVLYVNLEGFSGFRNLLGKQLRPDITDVIYQLRRGNEKLLSYVESAITHMGTLELLPPAENYVDIQAVETQEWEQLLHLMTEDGRYAAILLDISSYVQNVPELLRLCDQVIWLENDTNVALAKAEEYQETLKRMGYEDVLRRMQRISISKEMVVDCAFDKLYLSAFGDYVREIAKKELGFV